MTDRINVLSRTSAIKNVFEVNYIQRPWLTLKHEVSTNGLFSFSTVYGTCVHQTLLVSLRVFKMPWRHYLALWGHAMDQQPADKSTLEN